MKTLADFKRALTLGSFWEMKFQNNTQGEIRPVSHITVD